MRRWLVLCLLEKTNTKTQDEVTTTLSIGKDQYQDLLVHVISVHDA
jgi:hypothetical protein